jgi:hypothetical protein
MPPPPNQSGYRTILSPEEEKAFRAWFNLIKSQLGRDLDMNDPGYDMRGFWRAMQLGAHGAGFDPASGEIHFPDTFKTPAHPTQSAESISAPPGAPTWNQYDALIDQSGLPTLGFLGELIRRSQGR